MSVIVNYTCNGCGKWSNFSAGRESFNVLDIDISRYIAFSSGYVPESSKIKIHFCMSCYSKIAGNEMYFYGENSSADEMLKQVREKEKEIKKLKDEIKTYKAKVCDLLRPISEERND